jgi:hypothetical protein
MPTSHPDDDALEHYCIHGDATGQIERHLAQCKPCAERLVLIRCVVQGMREALIESYGPDPTAVLAAKRRKDDGDPQ